MSGDRVRIHVERLVLDGAAVTTGDRAAVVAAMQTELARLVGQPGRVPDRLRAASHVAHLRVDGDAVAIHGDAPSIGAGIARSVHAGLVHPPPTRGPDR